MSGRGRAAAAEITTKHPDYLKARRKLESRYAVLTMQDVALVTGYALGTIAEYARSGRYGAHKQNRQDQWNFDINEVRREIGLEPLSDFIG